MLVRAGHLRRGVVRLRGGASWFPEALFAQAQFDAALVAAATLLNNGPPMRCNILSGDLGRIGPFSLSGGVSGVTIESDARDTHILIKLHEARVIRYAAALCFMAPSLAFQYHWQVCPQDFTKVAQVYGPAYPGFPECDSCDNLWLCCPGYGKER